MSLMIPLASELEPGDAPTMRRLFTSSIVHISAYSTPSSSGTISEQVFRSHTIVLPLSGVRYVQGAGHAALADTTTFLLMNADVPYRSTQDSGHKGHVIVLRPDVLLRTFGLATDLSSPFPTLSVPVAPRTFLLKQLLIEQLERGIDVNVEEVEALVLQFLAAPLSSSAPWPHPSAVHDATTQTHSDCVDKVRLLLNERISDPIRLKDISAEVGVSPFHLCRIFKARTGLSIHRYLNQIRLRTALEHVAEPSFNLMNLALDLGFSSHSHFSFLFGREYGLSPTAFRRAVSHQGLRQATYGVTSRDLHLGARPDHTRAAASAEPLGYLAE